MRVTEASLVLVATVCSLVNGWGQNPTVTCPAERVSETTGCESRHREHGMLADRYEAVLQGEALERGLAPLGNGSRSAKVAAVARKLAGGEHVNVAVIGGSVVYGIGCTDPMGRTHMNCSWPGRLARALCAAFPKSDVSVLDLPENSL